MWRVKCGQYVGKLWISAKALGKNWHRVGNRKGMPRFQHPSIYKNYNCQPCWSPKCNNCPKCSKVLNVITFGPKCNKVLNVISLQCNRLTPSVHCCCGGHPHWDVKVTAVALKKPLTIIYVTLRARWYQSVSFYLLDIRNISSRSMVLI